MVWRIFARDVLRLLKNPVAVVITLGVALIPSLYAWFNIVANWDPYSNTGSIQVAVVNQDAGADNDLVGHLDAGGQVVSQLKTNHELGWRFVDESDAMRGVNSGEYYAAIVIPKDFSAKLIGTVTSVSADTSADGGNTNVTRRPQIDYYVNEKRNAIAPKITDTGATTIDQQINQTFVSTVSSTVVSKIKEETGEAQTKVDKTQDQLIGSVTQAMSDLDKARNAIDAMSRSIDAADTTLNDADRSLQLLSKQIASTRKTLTATGDTLGEARKESLAFTGTLDSALADGTGKLSGITVSANTAAGGIIGGLNTVQSRVDSAADAQQQVIDNNAAAISALQSALDLVNGSANISQSVKDRIAEQVRPQIDTLTHANEQAQTNLDTFRRQSSSITGNGINATTSGAKAIDTAASGGVAGLNATRTGLNRTITPSLLAGMDSFSAMTGTLDGTLAGLDSSISQSRGLVMQLKSTLGQTKTTLGQTSNALRSVSGNLKTTRTDLAALDSGSIWNELSEHVDLNAQAVGDFMASPVNLTTKTVYPVANYGSAVTPFYTNLALWVGGFVLIAIFKLEVDRDDLRGHDFNAIQGYLGRWLLLITVGFMQAIICTVGDLVIGIQCDHPLLFVLAGCWISFVYVNIIYALAAAFKHIGKAVAVILVIMQIPGSSGMYPIEMMPDFFQRLYPFLPFTYGINAMRETIGGMYSGHYWNDLRFLLWFLIAALFIGLVARQYLLNLNALFDRRLGATDLMVCEKNNLTNERFKLVSVVKLLMDVPEYRQRIRHQAQRFFRWYPLLINAGLVAIVVIPMVFLVLMFSVESKIIMLTAWITSIILIDVYLIVVEYMADSAGRQLGMSVMKPEDFRDAIVERFTRHHRFGAHTGGSHGSGVHDGGSHGGSSHTGKDGDRR
nr:YhgE/Pip domain-containing protein [Bifidobacterium margollesii]